MNDQLKAKQDYIPPAIYATLVEMEDAFGAKQVTFREGTEKDRLALEEIKFGINDDIWSPLVDI